MDDPDDPLVSEKDVPSYEIIEQKIKAMDNTIIIFRIYYLFNTFMFRFQLMKKDKMCIFEIPRRLLESLGNDGTTAERELSKLLDANIEDPECWGEFET